MRVVATILYDDDTSEPEFLIVGNNGSTYYTEVAERVPGLVKLELNSFRHTALGEPIYNGPPNESSQ